MQPGWLKQYYHRHVVGEEEHREETTAPADGEVSRRDFVKTGFVTGMAAGMTMAQATGGATPAAAQQVANPLSNRWWPSPLGAGDEQGAGKRITPAKVLEAARLIKTPPIPPPKASDCAGEAGARTSSNPSARGG